jgi:hypothetical protein
MKNKRPARSCQISTDVRSSWYLLGEEIAGKHGCKLLPDTTKDQERTTDGCRGNNLNRIPATVSLAQMQSMEAYKVKPP